MAQSSKRHRPPEILENMAQSSSKRQRPSGVLDSEPGCTPSKKSSSHGVTNKDDLGDIHKQVFNQKTLDIHVNMDIIEGKQKNKENKQQQEYQKNEMRKSVCALRNSGGGVLIVRIIGKSKAGYSNKFHLVFDDMFKTYLFEDEKFGDVYQFQNTKINIVIFIQGSSKIVTFETNTKEPIPKGIDTITAQRLFNYFPLKKCRPPVIRSKWVPSRYEEDYIYEEGENIQFKAYRNLKDFKNIEHRIKYDIRDYVSAFTKARTGGTIFFGIEEIEEKPMLKNSKPVVLGLEISFTEDDIKYLHDCLKEIVTQKMSWLAVDNTPKCDCKRLGPKAVDKYYMIRFHLLPGEGKRKHVIELSVAHFEGMVFQTVDGPTALEVNEKEKVCKISLKRWYSLMNKDAKDKEFEESDTNKVCQRFEELSISGSNLNTPKVYQIKRSLVKIRDSLFRMGKPMNLTPEAVVKNLKTRCDGKMAEALDKLKKYEAFKRNRSIGIFDYNFSEMLKEDLDSPLKKSCDACVFLCDAFIVGPDNLPLLTSFCQITNGHSECMLECREHNHRITKILTHKLRTYTRGIVGIVSYTINIAEDINSKFDECLQQQRYFPESAKEPGLVQAIQTLLAFVQMVASIPSPLRNIIDNQSLLSIMNNISNMLTLEQYQILHTNDRNVKRLLVHGLPGTGKTEVIKEVIRRLFNSGCTRHEILFVAENTTICDVIGRMGICTTLTRYELNEMWEKKRKGLMMVKHIFVDDAQFLDSKQTQWYKQLNFLCLNSNNFGMFWIFYGNHQNRNGPTVKDVISEDIGLFENRRLRSIIRNTKRIAEFANKYARDSAYAKAVRSLPHDTEGEEVSEFYQDLSNERTRYNAFESQMKDLLIHYKPGNIAVLYNKVDDIPGALKTMSSPFRTNVGDGLTHRSKPKSKLIDIPKYGEVKVVNASRNNAKDAVVVDSIRRYASLDRLLVIVIGCKAWRQNLEYSAFTRPVTKLIVVHHCVNA